MSQVLKSTARKSVVGAKKVIIRVPILRKLAIHAKAVLFPGMTSAHRETYHFYNYYPSIAEHMTQIKNSGTFKNRPLISLILPTYNTPDEYLRECLDSVLLQSYDNWELCAADDASPNGQVVKTLKEYAKKDPRIKLIVRKKNGHISEASNSAISLATGEFIGLLDHDDVLWPNALYEMVSVINANPEVDLIYTDEDKIDSSGTVHSYPFLKPDWSPEFLESCNYITHFTCLRTSLVREIGGFHKGCEGAQDWDLFVRITEKTSQVFHIPKILYSWRIHEASTAANTDAKPYVYEAQLKLLRDHLSRTGRSGVIEKGIITQHRTIKYDVAPVETLAVFVRHHDMASTKKLLRSAIKNEPGVGLEVFLTTASPVDGTVQEELQSVCADKTLRILHTASTLDEWRAAVAQANSNYFFFIDGHSEIVSTNWAKTIIGDSQLPGVGLVGPVILDPSRQTILSAGIGIGFGENGYADMLQGMPFDDPHYSRGLYAKSRRNVSALNAVAYAISKNALIASIDKGGKLSNVYALSKSLNDHEYRHIYTPYVQITYDGILLQIDSIKERQVAEDPYLNPNFNHDNQRMEVKA
jgi:glycosyltransferase involved in cell wall biosynthesis